MRARSSLRSSTSLAPEAGHPSRTKDIDDVDFSTSSVGLGVAQTLFSSLVQDYLQAKGWAGDLPEGKMVALVGDAEMDEGNIFEALLDRMDWLQWRGQPRRHGPPAPRRGRNARGARAPHRHDLQGGDDQLNPLHTIGRQLAEMLAIHGLFSGQAAQREAERLLDRVRIPAAASRVNDYPHSLSGGMRLRVMIAMALACKPKGRSARRGCATCAATSR